MCGEKVKRGYRGETPVGSPPHVRGKVNPETGEYLRFGITPACAGKRTASCVQIPERLDHPRMCGEKTKKIP